MWTDFILKVSAEDRALHLGTQKKVPRMEVRAGDLEKVTGVCSTQTAPIYLVPLSLFGR